MHATRVYLVLNVDAFIAMQYNLLCNTSFNKQGQAQCGMNGADYTAMHDNHRSTDMISCHFC